jgi:hypothetical protein
MGEGGKGCGGVGWCLLNGAAEGRGRRGVQVRCSCGGGRTTEGGALARLSSGQQRPVADRCGWVVHAHGVALSREGCGP